MSCTRLDIDGSAPIAGGGAGCSARETSGVGAGSGASASSCAGSPRKCGELRRGIGRVVLRACGIKDGKRQGKDDACCA